jgi:hypothetical protein
MSLCKYSLVHFNVGIWHFALLPGLQLILLPPFPCRNCHLSEHLRFLKGFILQASVFLIFLGTKELIGRHASHGGRRSPSCLPQGLKVPLGVLELQVELLPAPTSRTAIPEEDIVAQVNGERTNKTSAEREFLVYARRWWGAGCFLNFE